MPGIQYDEYGRPMTPTFRTPQDFVRYVEGLGEQATAGARRQADEIRGNPGGWEMSAGHPKKKDDWLARNLPWIGPAAVGAGIGGAVLAGGGAAASAGGSAPLGGVLPSSHLPAASVMGGPAAITSQGASALGAGTAAGAGAGASALSRIGNALTSSDGAGALASLLPMLLAARGGGGGGGGDITANMPQLNQLLDMTTQRAQRTDPLHQMVTRLAEQRMPIRSRG